MLTHHCTKCCSRPSLPLVFPVCEDGGGEDWKISTVTSDRQKIDTGGGMVPDEGS